VFLYKVRPWKIEKLEQITPITIGFMDVYGCLW
jgi:hypothetical protein